MLGTLVPLGALSNNSPLEYVGGSVLGAAAASVTISVLPVYTMLFVEWRVDLSAAAGLYLRLNGDSGTNYDLQNIRATSTTVTGARATGAAQWAVGTTADVNEPCENAVIIAKTTAGVAAQALSVASEIAAASIAVRLAGAQWNNTSAALTSVTILPSTGNINAGGTIAVYGIRG